MEKSYLRRPLAMLLSLLMVIGMFTVCGFGALAEGDTVTYTLAEWSVDDLDAAAQATGTKNDAGNPIYHKTAVTVGAGSSTEGWLFHSQGVTNQDHFEEGQTLRVIAYLKGELGTASAWGRMDVVYNNNDEYGFKVEFTPDVIAQMEDAPEFGEGVKKFVYDFELDDQVADDDLDYSTNGKLMQSRIWVNGGASLACYGLEYVNLDTGKNVFGLATDRTTQGSSTASFITRDALVSYCSHNNLIGRVPEADRIYVAQSTYDDKVDPEKSIFKGLGGQKLVAGTYSFNLDYAIHDVASNNYFDVKVYAGDDLIDSEAVTNNATFIGNNKWSTGSRITRRSSFEFTVDEAHSGMPVTFEVKVYSRATVTLYEADLTTEATVGDTVATWDYKDILTETDRSEVSLVAGEAAEKNEVVVGAALVGRTAAGQWGKGVNASNVTLTKGQKLRMVQQVYAPKGNSGALYFRAYIDGNKKIADDNGLWANYNAAETKIHETYGYAYREITGTYDVPDSIFTDGDTAVVTIAHDMMAHSADYASKPVYFYNFYAYDATTGDLVYAITGEEISNGTTKENVVAEPIVVDANNVKDEIGLIGTGGANPYVSFDHFIAARSAKADDEIEIGVEMWSINGFNGGAAPIGFEAGIRDAAGNQTKVLDWNLYGDEQIEKGEVEALVHPFYGYTYMPIVRSFTLTEELAAVLADTSNGHGINTLIGGGSGDKTAYPIVVYRYWVKNATTGEVYADMKGCDLMGKGGSHTTNAIYSVARPNIDTAAGAVVNANQSRIFTNLQGSVAVAGNYGMSFDVTGEAGKEYTLSVYEIKEDQQVTARTQTFTATGEEETVVLNFNAKEGMQTYTFGITTNDGTLDVRTISMVYNGQEFVLEEGDTIAAWDYKDLLGDSTVSEMGINEYDMTETATVGFQRVTSGGFDGTPSTQLDGITLTKGDTIRFTQKVYGPNGYGTPFWRVYKKVDGGFGGAGKIADTSTGDYGAAPVQYDETYGYAYKEFTYDVTITEGMAGTDLTIGHWFCVPSNNNYSVKPVQFFEFSAYNVTTGEMLYTIDCGEIADSVTVGSGHAVEPVVANAAGYDRTVGFRTTAPNTGSPTAFAKFDYFVKPVGEFDVDDEIEVGVWFWADNGVDKDANQGIDLNSKIRPGEGSEVHGASWRIATQEDYDAIETQYDSTYGFAYKEKVISYALTEEMVTALESGLTVSSKGFNVLFGDSVNAGHDWANYPLTTYRYWIYNKTKDVYYTDIDGGVLMGNGGSGTINEAVSVFIGNSDYALDGYVKANQDVVYENLNTTTPVVGNYSLKLLVQGEADAEYTITAYRVDADDLEEVVSETFTATGEFEFVSVAFDSYSADTYTFGISTGDADLTVNQVDFTLASFEVDTTEIDAVIALIDALPENVTIDNLDAIEAARAAYDALPAGQQALVTNYDKLVAAEATLAPIVEVITMIDNLEVNTYSHIELDNIQAAYAALDEEQRKAVTNYSALEEAIADHVALLESGDTVLSDAMEQKPVVPDVETSWLISGFDSSEQVNNPGADQRFPTVNGDETFMAYYSNDTNTKVLMLNQNPEISITDYTRNDLVLYMQVYVENVAAIGPDGQVEITSGGEPDQGEIAWTTAQLGLKEGWNELYLPLSSAAENQGSKGVAFDLADINYFRMYYIPRGTAIVAVDEAMIILAEDVDTIKANKAEAQKVIDQIAALPEDITVDDEAAVAVVREAYNDLTDAEKAYVNNLDELEAAEKTIADTKEAITTSAAVIEKIEALPAVDSLTLENETAVNEAKTAYDALNSIAKGMVSDELVTKLDGAVSKIAELKDQAAADAVIAKIEDLPSAEEVTGEDEADVTAAREAYEALTETQKALVSNLAKLEDVEEALANVLAVNYGDINGDGEKNASDALLALQHSVKLTKLEGNVFTAADVDENGEVNASDALYILQYSVKLIEKLPAEQ